MQVQSETQEILSYSMICAKKCKIFDDLLTKDVSDDQMQCVANCVTHIRDCYTYALQQYDSER